MPVRAMVPAAFTLMLQALDLVSRANIAKVGPDELARATHVFSNRLFTALHITPAVLHNMATHVHGVMSDPTKMEVVNRRAGVVKDPRASTPNDIGGENGV